MSEDITREELNNKLDTITGGAGIVVDSDMSLPKILISAADIIPNPKARAAVTIGAAGYAIGRKAWDFYKRQRAENTYRLRIDEDDPLYDVLHRWLVESLPDKDQKSLVITSIPKRNREYSVDPQTGRVINKISVYYDGTRKQKISIGGHNVTVMVDSDGGTTGDKGTDAPGGGGSKKAFISRAIIIECPTFEARKNVLKTLKEESETMTARRPAFKTALKWGSFRTNSDIPVRPIETVILKNGQSERIISDLKRFLTQEEEYTKIGIPYRRGVMLSGPPGTGKTSIASAIAHELKLDVYYISLSAVDDDNTLIELLGEVRERSVLLLEDVDVASATKKRTDDGDGVTMSGLLNALDGFVTPHGLITIMTTNHAEVLDPALVRPGRVDLFENITHVDNHQVQGLCKQFLGYVPVGLPDISEEHAIAPAVIIEVFKQYLENRDAAGPALIDTLNNLIQIAELEATITEPTARTPRAKKSSTPARTK